MEQLLEAIRSCRIYDLAQPYYPGMPHHPNHPPFLFGLNKKHGDYVASNGGSSASEVLTLGGHVGTHIDALCHFSCGGKLHGGEEAAGLQSYTSGLERHAVDTIAPIFRRGILLDIAGQAGVDALPADFDEPYVHYFRFDPERRHAEFVDGIKIALSAGLTKR